MSRLQGKVAIVTGAARGQGEAAVRRFVSEGARVMIADISDEAGEKLAAELGDDAVYQHLDVSSEDDWAAAVAACKSAFGQIDILVNNAGILMFASLVDTSLADYERIIRVNQIGTFLGMRSVVPEMIGGGSIINLSSVEGLGGMPALTAYASSKFAIRGMTKVAAMELGERGIRVNSVHPGAVDTPMLSDAAGTPIDASGIGRFTALKRPAQPAEIASVVTFLASDDASFCTGAEFVADGGATATHALIGG